MNLIEVWGKFLLTVGQPLGQSWLVCYWVHSCHPELSQLTNCLQVSDGDGITVDELGVFEEMALK